MLRGLMRYPKRTTWIEYYAAHRFCGNWRNAWRIESVIYATVRVYEDFLNRRKEP